LDPENADGFDSIIFQTGAFCTTETEQIQYIGAAIFGGFALGCLFMGPLADVVGRKIPVIICNVVLFGC
jgi:MFS family permease